MPTKQSRNKYTERVKMKNQKNVETMQHLRRHLDSAQFYLNLTDFYEGSLLCGDVLDTFEEWLAEQPGPYGPWDGLDQFLFQKGVSLMDDPMRPAGDRRGPDPEALKRMFGRPKREAAQGGRRGATGSRKVVEQRSAYYVESQPGDGTRYLYFCIVDGSDYHFVDAGNGIKYPDLIEGRVISEFGSDVDVGAVDYRELSRDETNAQAKWLIDSIADHYGCNPWTVAECIRTIADLPEMF